MSSDDLAVATALDLALARPARLGRTRLVCVDGPAGSGKTTFAEHLRAEASARGLTSAVVHMDDVYDGWEGLEDAGRRVQEQILGPLAEERAAAYSRYDWHQGRFGDTVAVPVVDILVLEGVGSADPLHDDRIGLVVWVWAPAELRLSRGIARDGVALEGRLRQWMLDERRLHDRHGTRERADLVVDGRSGSLSREPADGA